MELKENWKRIIRAAMEMKGWKMKDLASATGLCVETCRILGRSLPLGEGSILKMCRALDMNPKEIEES